MNKTKKVLISVWLFCTVTAMYFSEALESIYWRQNGCEHPNENRFSLYLILALAIPLIIMIITSVVKKQINTNVEPTFSWSYFAVYLPVYCVLNFIRDKGQQIAVSAYNTPNVDKAAVNIISLYMVGYIGFLILFFILDFVDRKKKAKETNTNI